MTPTEMLSRMTSRELVEQMAYDQLENEELTAAKGSQATPAPAPANLMLAPDRLLRRLDRYWPPEASDG